jgi:DNA-binding response OmpR family regulator
MKFRVMVLGSSEIIEKTTASLAKDKEIEVIGWSDVSEAITMLKQDKIDLALVDKNLCGLEDVCFRVTWIGRTPVALVTDGPRADLLESSSLNLERFSIGELNRPYTGAKLQAVAQNQSNQFWKIKVIVVEDDEHIGKAIQVSFRIFWPEADVIVVTHGEEGVRLAQREPVDIVLLDISLPDISGFEVLSRIRAFSKVPIIMVTADRTQEDIAKSVVSGANDYLIKPFNQHDLLSHVKKHVIQPSARIDNSERNLKIKIKNGLVYF